MNFACLSNYYNNIHNMSSGVLLLEFSTSISCDIKTINNIKKKNVQYTFNNTKYLAIRMRYVIYY